MPRVYHVKKARKADPNAGIEVGDEYYWWKFRFGPKRKSKTYPRRSQLTQSGFLSQLYDIEDGMAERFSDVDTLEDERDGLADELDQLRDECQESLDNMPYHLQDTSDAGILLTERIEGLDDWSSQIRDIDCDTREEDEPDEDFLSRIVEEIQSLSPF